MRPNITEGFIDPKNKYKIFRHDRVGRQGEGVCILTATCLNVVQVQFSANIEAVCLDINVSSSIYRFIAAYRPRGAASNDVDYNVRFNDCLQTLFNNKHCVLLVGDINCPGIDWQNG